MSVPREVYCNLTSRLGLGRDINNRSIWPSLTFYDFWMMLPEHHRATFKSWKRPRFSYLERLKDRKTQISAVLSELDGRSGHILISALEQAPEGHFKDRFTLFTMGFMHNLPRRPEDLEFWNPTGEEQSEQGLCSYNKYGRNLDPSVVELERHQDQHQVESALLDFPVYGETRSDGKHHLRWVAYDMPDPELSNRVRRLPQELVDKIYVSMLDATVGRREALLEHQSLYPHILRGMSRAAYWRYQGTWISEAIWVLSPRTYRVQLDRFRDQVYSRIHPKLHYGVRELIVRFDHSFLCRKCIEDLEAYFDPGSYPMRKDDDRLVPKDMFHVVREYTQKVIHAQGNMLRAWRTALEVTTFFDLRQLTLDFTDTYGLDGCWLGLQVVQVIHDWRSTRFHTKELIIKAPDQKKEELIWRGLGFSIL